MQQPTFTPQANPLSTPNSDSTTPGTLSQPPFPAPLMTSPGMQQGPPPMAPHQLPPGPWPGAFPPGPPGMVLSPELRQGPPFGPFTSPFPPPPSGLPSGQQPMLNPAATMFHGQQPPPGMFMQLPPGLVNPQFRPSMPHYGFPYAGLPPGGVPMMPLGGGMHPPEGPSPEQQQQQQAPQGGPPGSYATSYAKTATPRMPGSYQNPGMGRPPSGSAKSNSFTVRLSASLCVGFSFNSIKKKKIWLIVPYLAMNYFLLLTIIINI